MATKTELERELIDFRKRNQQYYSQVRQMTNFVEEQCKRLRDIGVQHWSWKESPTDSLNTLIGKLENWASEKESECWELKHEIHNLGTELKNKDDEIIKLKAEFYDKIREVKDGN